MGDEINVPHDAQKVFVTQFGEPIYLKVGVNNIIQTYICDRWVLPTDHHQMLSDAHRWIEAESITAN